VSAPEILEPLLGSWTGTNTLFRSWVEPPEPQEVVSPSTAVVERVAGGRFVSIKYTWEVDGAPAEGILLVGHDPKSGEATAAWADSWHMGHALLLSKGTADARSINVLGSYAVPPHPDWGWRTEFRPTDGGWEFVMHNISPEGEEYFAVRGLYERRG
jgi:Protein of unknown function (DUF1579)